MHKFMKDKPLFNYLISRNNQLKQPLRILTLSVLFLFFLLSHTQAGNSLSQDSRVSINGNNLTIGNFINQIENQTDYLFVYSKSELDTDGRLAVRPGTKTVAQCLREAFGESDINYIFENNYIVLTKNTIAAATQQVRRITGIVRDESGMEIIGANITEKGTTNGTITGIDGRFSLNVQLGKTLTVSYVGYTTIEVPAAATMDIVLKEDTKLLDEVVVVGYGTLDRKEVTSSISSVRSGDLIGGAVSNPLMAIQGKVTNLSIVSNGDVNAGTTVQLRGANSVKAGQGPLIVVDGIPGGNLNEIQKEDIVSIDVLKDASAAAIYGTRGSGGVILVTTRLAEEGPVQVSYHTDLTIQTVRRKMEVLSADEFLKYERGTDQGSRTDWFDEITRSTPFQQRHAVTLAGGTKNVRVYTSLYFRNAEGMLIETNRRELGGRMNVDYSVWDDRLRFTGRVNYTDVRAQYYDDDENHYGAFMMAMKLNPTFALYDETNPTGYNVLLGGHEQWNPVADIMLRNDTRDYRNLMASLSARLQITDDLSTTFTMGNKSNNYRRIRWESAQHKNSRDNNKNGWSKWESDYVNDVTLDWIFNYNKMFGEHSIKAVAGWSFQEFNKDGYNAENSDFPVDGVKGWDLGSGTYLSGGRAGMGSFKDPRGRLIAFLGRVNYSFQDKYILSLSARYEGTSRLAPDERWGLFPALSAGWRISSESFMRDISWISDLKIRFGVGKTGNMEGGDYNKNVVERMYSADTWWLQNGKWFRTYGLSHNVNKGLKWEEKTEYNLGIDYAFLNNRLFGKIDLYKRISDGIIYDISVPQPPAVHDKMTMNSGKLTNTGWEFEVGGVPVRNKDWEWTTILRLSSNTTKLNSLWGSLTYWDRKGFEAPGSPGTAVRLVAGEKIGRYYIWKYAGIDDDGNWLLYDKDNNVIPANKKTQEDKRFIGNAIPKVIASWDNHIRYKNFDLNLYFRSFIKYDVFNKINMYYGLANVQDQNVLKTAVTKNAHIKGEKELCDYWLEDGSFLKLDAVTLGYKFNIPSLEKYVRDIRVSVTARDLFCITGYSGLDPEVNINGLDPGFEERNTYPKLRTFTLGLQFNF